MNPDGSREGRTYDDDSLESTSPVNPARYESPDSLENSFHYSQDTSFGDNKHQESEHNEESAGETKNAPFFLHKGRQGVPSIFHQPNPSPAPGRKRRSFIPRGTWKKSESGRGSYTTQVTQKRHPQKEPPQSEYTLDQDRSFQEDSMTTEGGEILYLKEERINCQKYVQDNYNAAQAEAQARMAQKKVQKKDFVHMNAANAWRKGRPNKCTNYREVVCKKKGFKPGSESSLQDRPQTAVHHADNVSDVQQLNTPTVKEVSSDMVSVITVSTATSKTLSWLNKSETISTFGKIPVNITYKPKPLLVKPKQPETAEKTPKLRPPCRAPRFPEQPKILVREHTGEIVMGTAETLWARNCVRNNINNKRKPGVVADQSASYRDIVMRHEAAHVAAKEQQQTSWMKEAEDAKSRVTKRLLKQEEPVKVGPSRRQRGLEYASKLTRPLPPRRMVPLPIAELSKRPPPKAEKTNECCLCGCHKEERVKKALQEARDKKILPHPNLALMKNRDLTRFAAARKDDGDKNNQLQELQATLDNLQKRNERHCEVVQKAKKDLSSLHD